MNDGFAIDQAPVPDDERALDELLRKLDERNEVYAAANLKPESRIDELGSLLSAESAVLSWELVELIQPSICGGPEKCPLGRCRRARRCAELGRIAPRLAEARATLIRERALCELRRAPPGPTEQCRRRA
jgi:hypothetical protein